MFIPWKLSNRYVITLSAGKNGNPITNSKGLSEWAWTRSIGEGLHPHQMTKGIGRRCIQILTSNWNKIDLCQTFGRIISLTYTFGLVTSWVDHSSSLTMSTSDRDHHIHSLFRRIVYSKARSISVEKYPVYVDSVHIQFLTNLKNEIEVQLTWSMHFCSSPKEFTSNDIEIELIRGMWVTPSPHHFTRTIIKRYDWEKF